MTFKITMRGDATAPIAAEFECPEHGRFEVTMPRDRLPDSVKCTETVEHEHHCEEPPCSDCGFNIFECGETSPWRFPSPGAARVAPQMVQGKVGEYPGDKYVMNTQALADGMPLHEFKANRAKVHRDIALERVRKAMGR